MAADCCFVAVVHLMLGCKGRGAERHAQIEERAKRTEACSNRRADGVDVAEWTMEEKDGNGTPVLILKQETQDTQLVARMGFQRLSDGNAVSQGLRHLYTIDHNVTRVEEVVSPLMSAEACL